MRFDMSESMRARRRVFAACAVATLVQVNSAFAETRRLDCTLSRLQTKSGTNFDVSSEDKSIAVTFDEGARTLIVNRDGGSRRLDHVTITPISMTGYASDISLGVDRSSWSIVLQTYKANAVASEFGTCSLSKEAPPDH